MSKHALSLNLWVLLPGGIYIVASVALLAGIDAGDPWSIGSAAMGMVASYLSMSVGDRIYRRRQPDSGGETDGAM